MMFKRDEEPEANDIAVNESPVPERRHPREERAMAEQNGEVTIVGAGARLEGNVVSAGSLRIDGQVKPDLPRDDWRRRGSHTISE